MSSWTPAEYKTTNWTTYNTALKRRGSLAIWFDAPMLPDQLDQIPSDQKLGSVTADGAFNTRKCHEAIAVRGADAIIPPRKNAKPWGRRALVPSPETKLCAHHSTWAGRCGEN